jgi:hypothetical protein
LFDILVVSYHHVRIDLVGAIFCGVDFTVEIALAEIGDDVDAVPEVPQ